MAAQTSSRCDACGGSVGFWQAMFVFPSGCAHKFHRSCVFGSAACPVCAATRMLGQPLAAAATANSSSASTTRGVFGQQPQKTAANPFSNLSQPSERSLFAFGQQQAPPAKPNPFWLDGAPPAVESSAPPAQSPSSSCSVCSGVVGQGQATVTSECGHTFHLGCFSGSVCAACGARWREEVTVTLSPSCTVCGGAMGRGKAATVTSECGHTFHLRCISGSVCPSCGARWRDEVTVTPTPPSPLTIPSSSPARSPLFSTPSFGVASSSAPFPASTSMALSSATQQHSPFSSRPLPFGFSFRTPNSYAS